MTATHNIKITEEQAEKLSARKQSEYEPFHAVIERLLEDSEPVEDSDVIAEEITTAMANGDVPVVLAYGEAERIAQEVNDD